MCGSGKEENRMLQLLSGSQRTVDALGFLLAFALTALMDSVFREKLPHDHGRAFAVNGELSKGKARGSGLIFVLCIALVTLAVVPLRTEYIIYTVLLIASMLSGYFDDASEVAWNEYKKGLIDLVIAIVAGVTYLNFNSTTVNFLQWSFRSTSCSSSSSSGPASTSSTAPTVWTACRPAWRWSASAPSCWLTARNWGTTALPPSSSSAHFWPTCG